MRRRAGWVTMSSDSVVVKPTPQKAERACNCAASWESPVARSATVAILVINKASVRTTSSEATPINLPSTSSSLRLCELVVRLVASLAEGQRDGVVPGAHPAITWSVRARHHASTPRRPATIQ
jgi:hypothetical protein